MNRSGDEILREIAREEERLAELDRDRAEARDRIVALEQELGGSGRASPHAESPAPKSPAEKVTLFKSLFRGRPDIFPTHRGERAQYTYPRASKAAPRTVDGATRHVPGIGNEGHRPDWGR